MPFEDAALGRRRPLLQLTGGPIAAQPKLQLGDFRRTDVSSNVAYASQEK